jgi:hypothetical protein
MCREFCELADATPQSLLTHVGSTLAMSDLFNTDDCGADEDRLISEDLWSNE